MALEQDPGLRSGTTRQCRNCGSIDLIELGFIGKMEPFFLKRVFNIKLRPQRSRTALKQFARTLTRPLREPLSKLFSDRAFLEMQSCNRCSFVQVKHPFPEDWITRLYLDYRSATYNAERTHYEPSYAAIAARVGADPQEVTLRVEEATRFLTGKLETSPTFTMLDYGGADGRFLPALAEQRFVYEISDIAPVRGVTRIASEAALGRYSYVHLAHVLEHVVYPLQLVRKVMAHVEDSGYFYIEVPQEIDGPDLRLLQQGKPPFDVAIHEHINYFSIPALTQLMAAARLDLIAIEAMPVDLGWAKSTILRALGRKPSSSAGLS